MSQDTDNQDLNMIISVIERYPEGASLQDIVTNLGISLSTRSLQRRLSRLLDLGCIVVEGKARARRYKVTQASEVGSKSYQIPLSRGAEEVQVAVTKPVLARTPVGYNRKFLDAYRPNETSYLPKDVCDRFLELGKTDGERPAGTYAREIYNRILIDLSWNSSRLEGNTYSLLETELLLEKSEAAAGKDVVETQMILNHKTAIEFLIDAADEVNIDRHTVLNVHALLSDNLLADPRGCGAVRSKLIGIAKSVYHPLSVPNVIDECFAQVLDTARAIKNPFEQAFFLMVHLPYLQPFEDVNKRVSRLVANVPLIRLNLSPLSFADVPKKAYINGLLGVYELNRIDLLRDVFIWAYERSCALYSATCQSLGEPDPFRLKYRTSIRETVSDVVKQKADKKQAVAQIKSVAHASIPSQDQAKFVETVERELRSLHEGNIARFRLTPSEFAAWSQFWR